MYFGVIAGHCLGSFLAILGGAEHALCLCFCSRWASGAVVMLSFVGVCFSQESLVSCFV